MPRPSPTEAEYNAMEREVRAARRHRKHAAEDLAQLLGVPVAIDSYWRLTVMLDGQAVLVRDLIPLNVTLEKKA